MQDRKLNCKINCSKQRCISEYYFDEFAKYTDRRNIFKKAFIVEA